MEWLGYARTEFHHSASPVSLSLKSPNAKESTSLPELVKSTTPPCRLSPSLPGGHFQTVYAVMTKEDVPLNYKRRVFHSEDIHYPGSFAVDFVARVPDSEKTKRSEGLPPRTQNFTDEEWDASWGSGSNDSTPMLVVLHGLSGGSYEQYLKEVVAPLADGGFEAAVVNSRGCARSKITTGRLFNARSTWDVRQVVKWLRAKFPNRPLFGIGFSLGANILTNYCGEEGENCQLAAAVSCSSPWDLSAGNIALQSSYIGRELYSKTLCGNLKKLFSRHLETIKQNPDIDIEAVMRTKYLHEFDRAIQCPLWGYPSEGAYYRDASSTDPMLAIRIPFLAINAEDDPVSPKSALPYQEIKENPYAVMITTSMGGHLAWFKPGGGRWFVDATVQFLQKLAKDVDLTKRPAAHVNNRVRSSKLPTFDPTLRRLHWQD